MWFYTKVDADKKLEPSKYDRDAPISLSLLQQRHGLGDQPVLILRRDGKTVALLSESILPTSVCEASIRTGKKADPTVLIPIPADQERASSRGPAKGDLATLKDHYWDGVLSRLYQMERTALQLLPLSELPTRVADMWGRVHLEGMYVSKGLAPFALPTGTPQLETILA